MGHTFRGESETPAGMGRGSPLAIRLLCLPEAVKLFVDRSCRSFMIDGEIDLEAGYRLGWG